MFAKDKDGTVKRLNNPKIGYRFTEMYSFWVHVVYVNPEVVVVEEYIPPCEVPKDAKIKIFKREDFVRYYSYKGTPGSWVRYVGDDASHDHYNPLQHLVEVACGGVPFDSSKAGGWGNGI